MFARREGGDFHGLLQHVGLSEASGKKCGGKPNAEVLFLPLGPQRPTWRSLSREKDKKQISRALNLSLDDSWTKTKKTQKHLRKTIKF